MELQELEGKLVAEGRFEEVARLVEAAQAEERQQLEEKKRAVAVMQERKMGRISSS